MQRQLFPHQFLQGLTIATLAIGLVNCNSAEGESSGGTAATPQPASQESPQTASQPPSPPASNPVPTAPQTATNPPASTQPNPVQTPQTATLETLSCTLTMAIVNDPDAPLRVRSTPDASANNLVGQLDNGTFVTVQGEANGWLQISEPVRGWISKKLTDYGCNQKVVQVNVPSGGASFQITDRIIGTGSHRYQLNATQGQTLAISSQNGPLPYAIAPDGKELTNAAANTGNITAWQQVLPATGQYVLLLDSNFRGFSYDISVEVR
jgi:Bacterial SH3 domain